MKDDPSSLRTSHHFTLLFFWENMSLNMYLFFLWGVMNIHVEILTQPVLVTTEMITSSIRGTQTSPSLSAQTWGYMIYPNPLIFNSWLVINVGDRSCSRYMNKQTSQEKGAGILPSTLFLYLAHANEAQLLNCASHPPLTKLMFHSLRFPDSSLDTVPSPSWMRWILGANPTSFYHTSSSVQL